MCRVTARASCPAPGKARPLAAILAYQNPKVIWRFQDKFQIPTREAKALFRETLRWLWVCARAHELGGPPLEIRTSMMFMDEMWHEFILFTRDYERFCRDYLGRHIHHLPTTRDQKRASRRAWREDPRGMHQAREQKLLAQFAFIHEQLGGRVLARWAQTYKARYTPEFMNARRLPFTG
jgi:hypothetical protein